MDSQQQHGSSNPGEGVLMGGAILLTLYGLAILVASAFFEKALVPESLPETGFIVIGVMVVGGVLGGLKERLGR